MKRWNLLKMVIACAMTVFFVACEKEDPAAFRNDGASSNSSAKMANDTRPSSEMDVKIYADPGGGYQELVVDIQEIYLVLKNDWEAEEYVPLKTNVGLVDLRTCMNGPALWVAQKSIVPTGEVFNVHFRFGDQNHMITRGNKMYHLNLDPSAKYGIDLPCSIQSVDGEVGTILLHFKTKTSIYQGPLGKWFINPDIEVE